MDKIYILNKFIGGKARLNYLGDIYMDRDTHSFFNKDLKVVKITKGGMAILKDPDGNEIIVPPRNVDIIADTEQDKHKLDVLTKAKLPLMDI